MMRKEDLELRSSELVAWLQGEIHERDRMEGKAIDRTRLPISSHADSGHAGSEREPDVRVLMSQTKSKKTNRRNIVADGEFELSYTCLFLII
jgi:translation initiation factor 2-alpha kinase 4